MSTISTPIIPYRQTFAKTNASHELDLEAICVFAAIGFFLDRDTYWKDTLVLQPASKHIIDDSGVLKTSVPWFKWHYEPRTISFNEALDEFTHLFESIIKEQIQGKNIILPLSGGLDSRTQAAALKHLNAKVNAYSYQFENGYPETNIARSIAKVCDFEFKSYTIPKGYLWNNIDALAELNLCYTDFTNSRQMSIINEIKAMGDLISLGHWGDVLFDSMNLPELTKDEQLLIISKKLLKRGGMEFATKLWEAWGLKGTFYDYFNKRIKFLLEGISIEDTNAKLRAFKSLYWAPRWTTVNLRVFESQVPIHLPYYDDRMCQFICSIPETYLNDRKLQIAYIKHRVPKLAQITWQDQRPFNLNNYHFNRLPYNLPYKVYHKLARVFKSGFGKPYIQRNWELQFLGKQNDMYLRTYLFENGLETIVPKSFIHDYYQAFKNKDALKNSQAINILLVLSKFQEKFRI